MHTYTGIKSNTNTVLLYCISTPRFSKVNQQTIE